MKRVKHCFARTWKNLSFLWLDHLPRIKYEFPKTSPQRKAQKTTTAELASWAPTCWSTSAQCAIVPSCHQCQSNSTRTDIPWGQDMAPNHVTKKTIPAISGSTRFKMKLPTKSDGPAGNEVFCVLLKRTVLGWVRTTRLASRRIRIQLRGHALACMIFYNCDIWHRPTLQGPSCYQ